MAYSTFAAIDIASDYLELSVYEVSKDTGIKRISQMRHTLELGRSTYNSNEISFDAVEEICEVLTRFKKAMKEYDVSASRSFATSALREAKNALRIIDRIKVRTGFEVEILSNSEARFLSYKAIAAKNDKFNKIIEKSTALVDVGAGSAQISLFDNGSLVTTQNVKLGALRLSEMMSQISRSVVNSADILKEFVDNDMDTLNEIFLKNKKIHNVIFAGDFIPYYIKHREYFKDGEYAKRDEFERFYEKISHDSIDRISTEMNLSTEKARQILPSAMIYKRMLDFTKAEDIWMPGTSLCDGIAVEYAQKEMKYKLNHDFNGDILAAAKNISKRYSIRKEHINLVESSALKIFDSIKKYHGLSDRERFLLQIACILHDCGQYINMLNPEQCSYSIIMSTEIIGLSHKEREIIASVVKYNTIEFDADDAMWAFDRESYMIVAKLACILRISNALDKGHRQKFKDMKVEVEKGKLVITIDTFEDITLEKIYFNSRTYFFEETYGLKPVIKQRRQ